MTRLIFLISIPFLLTACGTTQTSTTSFTNTQTQSFALMQPVAVTAPIPVAHCANFDASLDAAEAKIFSAENAG